MGGACSYHFHEVPMKKLALAFATLCFAAAPVLACPHSDEKPSEEVKTADKAKEKEKQDQEKAKAAEKAKEEKAKKEEKKPADKVSTK
jgi:hypothetical protein